MALCEILDVNCIIWELRQQYAEVIFRYQRPGQSQTVHLLYAARRHYEYTDILKVNLFLFFHNNLAILFTCIFFRNSFLQLLLHMPDNEGHLESRNELLAKMEGRLESRNALLEKMYKWVGKRV